MGDAAGKGALARQWKVRNRPGPQVEAQQINSQARHFLPRGEETGWRPGRVGDIPDDGMCCSTQTIRSNSLERLPWSETEDLGMTCQVSPCKCKFAQSRHRFRLWDSPTHKTNLGMRWIDLSRERNAGTIYDYRMAQMYEYCYIGSVDVPASQSNLHV